MRVKFSKDFSKAMSKLTGKIRQSTVSAINGVIDANNIDEISNCKKIESLNSVYRIRIGDKRAFFVLHVQIEGDLVMFEYLLSRGEAYDKKNMQKLRKKDC
ncbi:MAG: hypothetical protein K2L22_12780 [Muribaculaceae bacterium]|nr:hypothetical protein [Muribaculaceae bacterium]